jgi:hypothetical protein
MIAASVVTRADVGCQNRDDTHCPGEAPCSPALPYRPSGTRTRLIRLFLLLFHTVGFLSARAPLPGFFGGHFFDDNCSVCH